MALNQQERRSSNDSNGSTKKDSPSNTAFKLFKKLGIKDKDEVTMKNEQEKNNGVVTNGTPDHKQTVDSLPQVFHVKYLGRRPAKGLWGIKHTRKPVEELVNATKKLKEGELLPELQLHISEKGIHTCGVPDNKNNDFEEGLRPIDSISYGVQDTKYTRVFAMIVVNVEQSGVPAFTCHAYVCTSRANARRMALTLALAFQEFGNQCSENKSNNSSPAIEKSQKLAIDLRSPEEIEQDLIADQELDSEA